MKKYRVSNFYRGIYTLGMVICLIGVISGVRWLIQDQELLSLVPLAAGAIGLITLIFQMFFDFQGGRFSVDKQGITMYIGWQSWFHTWNSIKDCDIVGINVADGNTYWVYFAAWQLDGEERRLLLRKTRRDLQNIALFQYNESVLQEILPSIPNRFSTKLQMRAYEIDSLVGHI